MNVREDKALVKIAFYKETSLYSNVDVREAFSTLSVYFAETLLHACIHRLFDNTTNVTMRDPMEDDKSIVKPGMNEYHTGHLPKPKLPTIKGALDTTKLPQRAEFGTTISVATPPQRAILWAPPVTNYTLHYSRVDNYFTDLNDGIYEDMY